MATRREDIAFSMPDESGNIESPESSNPNEYAVSGEPQGKGRGKGKRKGAFVPLTDDGQLDAARVKDPETLEQIRAALALTPASGVAKEKIDRSLVPLLIEAYTVILRQGSRLLKFPDEVRERVRFDNKQVENMTEPIGRMLDKFAPALLAQNQEIAAFVAVMVMESQKSLVRAVVEHGALAAQAQTAQPTNGKVSTQTIAGVPTRPMQPDGVQYEEARA
jgi:hypothetical protein